MPESQHVVAQLSDFLDGELSRDEHLAVGAHLERCASCRQVLDELRQTINALRQLPRRMPSED
jgi:anti-sigma factor RsiW